MTVLNQELYEAFKEVGASEGTAKRAAASVYDKGEIATKLDIAELKTEIQAMKGEIQAMLNRHLLAIIGAMVGLTAIFSAVVVIALRLVVR
jgi:hypothetical protein